jgi:hypothetical protein
MPLDLLSQPRQPGWDFRRISVSGATLATGEPCLGRHYQHLGSKAGELQSCWDWRLGMGSTSRCTSNLPRLKPEALSEVVWKHTVLQGRDDQLELLFLIVVLGHQQSSRPG